MASPFDLHRIGEPRAWIVGSELEKGPWQLLTYRTCTPVKGTPEAPLDVMGLLGIVQKVFSEKASAIARMRQKCVRNASKMRLVLLGKEERSKMRQNIGCNI